MCVCVCACLLGKEAIQLSFSHLCFSNYPHWPYFPIPFSSCQGLLLPPVVLDTQTLRIFLPGYSFIAEKNPPCLAVKFRIMWQLPQIRNCSCWLFTVLDIIVTCKWSIPCERFVCNNIYDFCNNYGWHQTGQKGKCWIWKLWLLFADTFQCHPFPILLTFSLPPKPCLYSSPARPPSPFHDICCPSLSQKYEFPQLKTSFSLLLLLCPFL